jgi:4-hydroxybenzoate polyprenyltransferase
MAGIYDDDDDTNSARVAKRKSRKRKAGAKSFLANSLGSIGALIVTFLVSYAIALAMLWIAGRMVSIGGFGGLGPAGVIAIILTAVFYWYDRNNP